MGLSYKQSSVPATLREGEFAVVGGVTYVGNGSNEPVQVVGLPYKEYKVELTQSSTNAPTASKTFQNDDILQGTSTRSSAGTYRYTFDEDLDFSKLCVLTNTVGLKGDDESELYVDIVPSEGNNRIELLTLFNQSRADDVLSNGYIAPYCFNLQYFE